MKNLAERLAEAQAIISGFKQDIKTADNLANRPRIYYARVDSKQVIKNRELRATSMNDILDQKNAAWMLQCPEFKKLLQDMSDILNSPRRK